jgi:hypothetical protein
MSIPGNNVRGIVIPRGRKNIQRAHLKERGESEGIRVDQREAA